MEEALKELELLIDLTSHGDNTYLHNKLQKIDQLIKLHQ
jgi:hypothetical protein